MLFTNIKLDLCLIEGVPMVGKIDTHSVCFHFHPLMALL